MSDYMISILDENEYDKQYHQYKELNSLSDDNDL